MDLFCDPLVVEVADPADDHRHPVLVGGGDDLVVPDRAARVQRPPSPRPWRPRPGRPGTGRTRRSRRPLPRGRESHFARAHDGDARGVHAVHLPGPDADHLIRGRQHDGVGLGVLGDAPREPRAPPSRPRWARAWTRRAARTGRGRRRSASWSSRPPITLRASSHARRILGSRAREAGRCGIASWSVGALRARPRRTPARRGSRAGCRTAP